MFELIDVNCDGRLSIAELHRIMLRLKNQKNDLPHATAARKISRNNSFLKMEDNTFFPEIVIPYENTSNAITEREGRVLI